PLRLHVRVRGLHGPQRALHGAVVEVEVGFVDSGERHLGSEGVGVVHERVDAAVVVDGRADRTGDGLLLEDVALDPERVDAELVQLGDDSFEAMRLPLGDHDGGATSPEMVSHAPTDALTGTGDEHDLAVDAPHGAHSMTPVSGFCPPCRSRIVMTEPRERWPCDHTR